MLACDLWLVPELLPGCASCCWLSLLGQNAWQRVYWSHCFLECRLSWLGRRGGRGVGQLVFLGSREAERKMNAGARLDFPFLV